MNEKAPIRAVVFDYGKVLARPPLISDVQAMAQIFGVTVERFEELYWGTRLAYDRGDVDVVSYWTSVAAEASRSSCAPNGTSASVALASAIIENLIEIDTRSWSRPDEATVQWALQLRQAGLELAVLSNMPLELSRRLVADCQWLSVFDKFTFSCYARAVKPEAAIYRACLDKLHTPSHKVLFLDDRAENVEGAIAAGMQSVVFDDLESTMERVATKFDVPLPARK
ncbi:MAG: HAD family phosphatase [Acidobacteriota bacterium]|nr:HAD family phosphatase [Acidobacteriota bacterium]